jgi:ATP-dependent DNA helicase RecG
MNDIELEALLREPESDRAERKSSIADRDRICEAICAFANDLPNHRGPGIIFVGVKDDGSCADLPVTDELLRSLADLRANGNIYPFPGMTVQRRKLYGCEMAVIEVMPSDYPPVHFRGRTWVRVGPRRAIATQEEERRLGEKRRKYDVAFDARPVPGSTVDDLDLILFEREYLPSAVHPDVLSENARSVEHQLSALRFTTIEGVPTVSGLLVIGKDPTQYVPGAFVQFLRLNGSSLASDIKDEKGLSGCLIDLLRQIDEILKINISTAIDTRATFQVDIPDYPLSALQQIVRNAMMHRTYEATNAPVRLYWFDDRVEVHSPGGPFGLVTRNNFGQPGISDYRNPNLAEAMKALGYVQRFGIGIAIARQELQRNGNPPLEFMIEDTYILAVLRKRK